MSNFLEEFNQSVGIANRKRQSKPKAPIDYSKYISREIPKEVAKNQIRQSFKPAEETTSDLGFTNKPYPSRQDSRYKSLRNKDIGNEDKPFEFSEKQEAGLGIAAELTKGMGSGGSSAGGAISGATSGAVMGAKFGPQGAVVGAVAGGIMGIMGAKSKRKQRRREAEAQAQGLLAEGEAQKAAAYGQLKSSMSSAFTTAATRKKTVKL